MKNQPSKLFAKLDRTREASGFTLIELLAVMSMIIILVGITIPLIGYGTNKADESSTKTMLKAMENALETYKADNGGYPPLDLSVLTGNYTNFSAGCTNNSWTNITLVYRALSGSNGSKSYITFKSNQLLTNSLGIFLKDPFGKLYGYNPKNPVANPSTFDLWSAGADGKSQYPTNLSQYTDDIGNWSK